MLQSNRKQILWQTIAFIALAMMIALAFNQWRSDRIPLVEAWSAEARLSDTTDDSLIINLEHAQMLFEQNKALFVDARPKSQYAAGHIKGAIRLPWQEIDRYFAEMAEQLDGLDGTDTIIAYCDGQGCDLSHELALFLQEMGFSNVRVLINGWTVWQQAGLPTQRLE